MQRLRSYLLLFILMPVLSFATGACDDEASAPGMIDGPVSENSAAGAFSTRLCYEYRECDCGGLAGVSLNGCEQGLKFSWQAIQEEAAENGLTFDGDCMARKLNAMRERGCAPVSEGSFQPGCYEGGETCQIYHGAKLEGEDCEGGSFGGSDCAQGLRCFGTCEQPCALTFELLAEGATCYDGQTVTGTCEPPLLCDSQGTGTCIAPGSDGEPCALGTCAAGHWCEFGMDSQTCRVQVADNGACMLPQECASLNCTENTCAAAPTEGEPCSGVCAGELVCAIDDTAMLTCRRVPAAGEPCLTNVLERCQEGLTCIDEVCANKPGEGESCMSTTTLVECQEPFICGAKLCSTSPNAPGCDQCDDPDFCVVQVCTREPPAVCGDSGGLYN